MGKRNQFQDWGLVERWQANTLAARLVATLPSQWAEGVAELRRSPQDTPVWMRNSAWLERLLAFKDQHGDALHWSMSDADICERAQAVAEGIARLMDMWHEPATAAEPVPLTGQSKKTLTEAEHAALVADLRHKPLTDAEQVALVRASCRLLDVDPPEADTPKGVIGKGQDVAFWRKRLRQKVARVRELGAIKLGVVNHQRGGYCSNAAVENRQQQLERAAAMMDNTLVRNEAGQVYRLGELARLGVSDRDVRRGELMVRIRGCEEYADAAGHVGLFFTLTLPSRFHAMVAPPKGTRLPSRKNPRYDGSSPREGQAWLCDRWADARAALDKAGIRFYGFRVAEPHHDGCPHWHSLFWFQSREEAQLAAAIIKQHWLKPEDWEFPEVLGRKARSQLKTRETGARKNRVNVKWLDAGGAAAYIAKYVAKNVGGAYQINHLDGEADGHAQGQLFDVDAGDVPGYVRVDAWAATWGIRQFQPIGQPSVVAWREMRRVSHDQVEQARIEGDTIAWRIYGAVHKVGNIKADWRRFMELMGGPCRKRGEWAMSVAHRQTETTNRYGETVEKRVAVGLELKSGRWLISRRQAWNRVADGRQEPGARAAKAAPWTCFNNCRARLTGELRRAALGRGDHEKEDWCTPDVVAHFRAMRSQRSAEALRC